MKITQADIDRIKKLDELGKVLEEFARLVDLKDDGSSFNWWTQSDVIVAKYTRPYIGEDPVWMYVINQSDGESLVKMFEDIDIEVDTETYTDTLDDFLYEVLWDALYNYKA